jgi:hypothetical protein
MGLVRLFALATITAALVGWADKPDARSADGHARKQCQTVDLRLRRGPEVSPATGQNPLVFRLVNRGARQCWLKGYPSVALIDSRGHSLPFAISHRGDQMVTPNRPKLVIVPRGRSAFFLLNKYRCDLGNLREARRVRVHVPGEKSSRGLTITLPQWPAIGYCGRGDAGSTVAVSPVAKTVAGTRRSH